MSGKTREEFSDWLQLNRPIYDSFVAAALKMKRTGRGHYSSRTIVELLRWHSDLRDSDTSFKINHNMAPQMARHAMRTNFELAGFFRTVDRGNE